MQQDVGVTGAVRCGAEGDAECLTVPLPLTAKACAPAGRRAGCHRWCCFHNCVCCSAADYTMQLGPGSGPHLLASPRGARPALRCRPLLPLLLLVRAWRCRGGMKTLFFPCAAFALLSAAMCAWARCEKC